MFPFDDVIMDGSHIRGSLSSPVITHCICPKSHKAPFRAEMSTILCWMVHYDIWDKWIGVHISVLILCIVGYRKGALCDFSDLFIGERQCDPFGISWNDWRYSYRNLWWNSQSVCFFKTLMLFFLFFVYLTAIYRGMISSMCMEIYIVARSALHNGKNQCVWVFGSRVITYD